MTPCIYVVYYLLFILRRSHKPKLNLNSNPYYDDNELRRKLWRAKS